MKVKDESYLRSPLLRETFKNSSDPSERLWYATVPSVTQIWTRRPQWRRRHKNRKKSKYHRFPLPAINSRIDESDLWDTLKPLEGRPCSRSSTSPYETCSSRPFVTESDLSRNDDMQRNHRVFNLPRNQRSQPFDRKSSVCETRSDSGLRRARGTQLVRPIRSQKRLGVRSSANSQSAVGTLSSLEADKSIRLSVGRELLSDFSIPKRRVTFSNYVSENSATDTRSQISAADNDPRESTWWERSCGRLTDDEDNSSLRADLSCLFSSTIFDESKSSFFSLTASLSSEKSKKSAVTPDRECNECIFYVNPSYSNESSCDLVSLPTIYAIDDRPERDGVVTGNDCFFGEVLAKRRESQTMIRDEKISKRGVPDAPIFRKINTDPTYRRSIKCINDRPERDGVVTGNDCFFGEVLAKKNESQTMIRDEKISKRGVPDAPIFREINTDPTYRRSIKCINDRPERDGVVTGNDCFFGKVLAKRNESQTMIRDEKISRRVVPDAPIFREINTDPTYRRSIKCINDRPERDGVVTGNDCFFGKVLAKRNESQTMIRDEKISRRGVPDAPIFREINTDPTYRRSIKFINDRPERAGVVTGNDCFFGVALGKRNESQTMIRDEKISKRGVPDAPIFREINTDPTYRRSIKCINDCPERAGVVTGNYCFFGEALAKRNESQTMIRDEKISRRVVPDALIFREINTDLMYRRSIECINDRPERAGVVTGNGSFFGVVLGKRNESQTMIRDEKISRRGVPDAPIFRKINTDPTYRRSIECINDRPERARIVTGNDCRFGEALGKRNESQTMIRDEKISKRTVPDAPIFREINTDPTYRRSIECINIRLKDISSTVKEVSIGSGNDTVQRRDCDSSKNYVSTYASDLVVLNVDRSLAPVAESLRNRVNDAKSSINETFDFRNGGILRETNELQPVRCDAKVSKRVVPDAKIFREINTDLTYRRTIECINIRFKDISSAVKEVLIASADVVERSDYDLSKNHETTDTGDLVLNVDRSLTPVAESLRNRANDPKSRVDETFDFLQQPKNRIDAAFLLKELSRVGARTFDNRVADTAVDNIGRIRGTDLARDSRKSDNVDLLRIDTETCGEIETVLIEVENLGGPLKEDEVLRKSSSMRVHNCLRAPCESLVVNLGGIGKDSELVVASASNFHNEYADCSGIAKCCLICGRKNTDNPRYLRPVCQVKGVTPTSRLENDPWISVMSKAVKHENGKELTKWTTKNVDTNEDRRSFAESSKDPNNFTNEPSHLVRNESETIVEGVQEESFSVTITGAENSSPSMGTVESNVYQVLSSRDQSTSCPPEPERSSSTSFGFATFRGPRTQSAKTYFMRESIRTVEGTANRLLCVISESDSLMAVPPFLPKKPPDWFGRHRMLTKKSSRR